MEIALYGILGLAGLIQLAVVVVHVIIIVHAFKTSAVQGLLSLFVPLYILYFAFARWEHPKKAVYIGVWLGGAVLANVLVGCTFALFLG
jgi:hypothetical protein